MALTEKRIRDLKPAPAPAPGKRPKLAFIWDDTVRGLGVRVAPAGEKSYVLSYRANGRKRIVTLARCSELSLADARKRAGRLLVDIRDGNDPLQSRQELAQEPTVAVLWQRFEQDEAPQRMKLGRLKTSTLEWYGHVYRKHVAPALGQHKVAKVRRGDVEHAVAALTGSPRNATLSLLSRLFTLAEHWEWRPQHANPVRGIERARQDPRDRVLSPDELAALAGALATAGPRYTGSVGAVRFAALTGLRIGEVIAVQWEHIDFEAARLLLPETKTGRRRHDLPAPALQLLAELPRTCAWAFSNDGGKPSYAQAAGAFRRAADAAGLENVTLHDLRRTVMTTAAADGVSAYVMRDLLGHKTSDMADRYIRSLDNPVRSARERVAATMAAQMAGQSAAEVVPLRRGDDQR